MALHKSDFYKNMSDFGLGCTYDLKDEINKRYYRILKDS